MMALRHRDRTGQGQVVDTALYECAFSFMEAHIAAYEKTGYIVGREGAGHSNSVVNNLFRTRDGVYVHVQGSQTNSFRRLCLGMGRPDILEDARFNTRLERVKHGGEMDAIVAAWCGERDYETVEREPPRGRRLRASTPWPDLGTRISRRGDDPQRPRRELSTVAMAAPVRLTRTPGRS
jgi:crotonobetainyl-CoA:carnitine CoA-transferase CaiB-like acyl-CoA transferase